MGNIGQAIATRASAFGMKIVYNKRTPLNKATEMRYKAVYLPFDELLRKSDIISLNVPYSAATHHLIGEKEFAMMKDDCILINTARGAIIDEAALINNLKNGKLWGAGLDVFEFEPIISKELLQLDNVVLAPHIAQPLLNAVLRWQQSSSAKFTIFSKLRELMRELISTT